MNTIELRKNESLSTFGDRADVREMFDRIRVMVPGALNAPNDVVMMAAQKAVAHGLDLFDGEMYIMQVQGRWEAHVGVKGLRRNAGDNAHFEESDEYPRRLSDQELEEDLGKLYKPGSVGIEVRLYNLPKARQLKDLGITYSGRRERGYWIMGENIPNTRTSAWVAQKRAEKVALRAEFPLKWSVASDDEAFDMLERADTNHQCDTALIATPNIQREEDGDILFP